MLFTRTLSLTLGCILASGPAFAACEGVKLHDLSGGSITVDSVFMSAWGAGGEPVPLVVPVHLVEHPQGLVLYDTGIADDVADGGCADYWGAGLCDFVSPEWSHDHVVDRKLAQLGFALDQVGYVVYSHFHFDHTGNMEMFPDATHVVQKVEIRHAWWPEKLFRGAFVLKDFDEARDFDFWEVDGDLDLFGDGCVRLIATPGHTPGHQSMLVRLPNAGPVLLTGDAVVSTEQMAGTPPGFTQSLTQSMDSIARMKRLRDVYGAAIWVSHDMAEFNARMHDRPYE